MSGGMHHHPSVNLQVNLPPHPRKPKTYHPPPAAPIKLQKMLAKDVPKSLNGEDVVYIVKADKVVFSHSYVCRKCETHGKF